MDGFIDRERELQALTDRLSRRASLALLYGQRRVGKTFLLQRLVRGRARTIYFLADESTSAALLRRFHVEVSAAGLGGPMWPTLTPTDWGTSLTLLFQAAIAEEGGLVLVLDELQYLIAAESALPSIIQRLWDSFRGKGRLHVILCGSALGVMARLGDERQPLHGRFDLRLQLTPFRYADAARFVPTWGPADALRAYGVFGGLARHLAELDPTEELGSNVCRAVLDPLAPLHEAPLDLLRTEHLSSHADANAVLAAVAAGENRFTAIAARAGLGSDRVAYVTDELITLEILRRERRFGDRPGSRYTRYRCADPFTTFWFRHVQRNRSALASAGAATVWRDRVAPRLEGHMGHAFEAVVAQAITAGTVDACDGPIDELAPWWSRDGQTEIDLVARSGDRVTYVECKWRAGSHVGLEDLHRVRDHLRRYPGFRPEHRVALASMGTFSEPLRAVAAAGDVLLWGPESILGGREGASDP